MTYTNDTTLGDRLTAVICGSAQASPGTDFAALGPADIFLTDVGIPQRDPAVHRSTYYVCADAEPDPARTRALARLVADKGDNGIRSFLLRDALIKELGEGGNDPRICSIEKFQAQGKAFAQGACSSSLALALGWALTLGYEKIALAGMNDEETRHLPSWEAAAALAKGTDALVINMDTASRLPLFLKRPLEKVALLFSGALSPETSVRNAPGLIGIRERNDGIRLDEIKIMKTFLTNQGTMIDVGAMRGGALRPFLSRGWEIHAFEPDSANRDALADAPSGRGRLHVDPRAVSDVSGLDLPWYTSETFPGIGSLTRHHPTHKLSGSVRTVCLEDYCRERGVEAVDFLHADTRGTDFPVLRGFPFQAIKPACVLCGFDNTTGQNDTSLDIGHFLLRQGYHVYLSERHAGIGPDSPSPWRRLVEFPSVPLQDAKGKMLAFLEEPEEATLRSVLIYQCKR